MRLSVHPGVWRAERDRLLALLDQDVRAAVDRGLVAIIDWHGIGWPGAAFERPEASWGLPADAFDADLDLAVDFWRTIAARDGADPRIVFEIWNEPVRLEPKGRRAGPGEDWAALRPVWMELTREIRRHGGNLVLATGGSWAADLTGIRDALLPDPNTAYAWHVYPATGRGERAALAALLDDLDRVRPVVVTEWGCTTKTGHLQGTSEGIGRLFADGFLAARGLHWTALRCAPMWDPPPVEADWTTPTASGALVVDLLRKPAG